MGYDNVTKTNSALGIYKHSHNINTLYLKDFCIIAVNVYN